jgi:hypothetical protein
MAPRRIKADIGGQRGLAHARPTGQDHEVRGLQAAQPAVEAPEPCGHASDAAVVVERQLGAFGSPAQRLVQGLHPAPSVSCLGELEQTAFGLFDNIRRASLMLQPEVIGITQDLLAQRDQLAAHIQVMDRAAVILGIDDRDDASGKIGEIFRTTDMRKVVVLLKIVLQGDRTGHLAALGQLENRLIQALMHRNKEMERAQKITDFFQGVVVKHQRAQ